MWGVEMAARVAPTVQRAFEAGLLKLQAGPNVLRLLPPHVIFDGEIARGLDILEDVL